MKKLLCVVSLFLSVTAFGADQSVLLDASCKIYCHVTEAEIYYDQGGPISNTSTERMYKDFSGYTREQMDSKTKESSINLVCQEKFGKQVNASQIECLYFKH